MEIYFCVMMLVVLVRVVYSAACFAYCSGRRVCGCENDLSLLQKASASE
jgi:hypothetical protein